MWSAEAGKVNGKSAETLEINPQLEEIKARINNHYYQILRAKSTYNKYLTVYKHLKAFMWEKRKRTDMAYKELTKDFIDDFDSYLRNKKELSANTLWIYTTLSLTGKAWPRGIIRTDLFSEYSLEMQETDRGYLTEEELKLIANTVFVDKQTNLVRDMFLFGCFTFVALINTAL